MIYKLDRANRDLLSQLFENNRSPKVLTYLQGYAGVAYVDNLENPTIAVILVSIFASVAGNPQALATDTLLKSIPNKRLIIAPTNEWNRKIEEVLTTTITKHKQYQCSSSINTFNLAILQNYVKNLPKGYTLQQIDKTIISDRSILGLPQDFTENFGSDEEFIERGVGFWILHNGVVVSGATSLSIYNGGIEVDIETLEEYRGKGLATIVTAQLLIYSIEHNIYPCWEAANLTSLRLALKLGYLADKEIDCYWIWRED